MYTEHVQRGRLAVVVVVVGRQVIGDGDGDGDGCITYMVECLREGRQCSAQSLQMLGCL